MVHGGSGMNLTCVMFIGNTGQYSLRKQTTLCDNTTGFLDMMSEEQARKFYADDASLPGCSLGFGDWRILHLLCRILWLMVNSLCLFLTQMWSL